MAQNGKWNSLIPIEIPQRYYSNFWVLKISNFTKQNFTFKVAFN